MKHLVAIEIHAEIHNILREAIMADSTLTRYFRKLSFTDSSDAPPEELETEYLTSSTALFSGHLTNTLFRYFSRLPCGYSLQ
jgi:hypothetical protein